LGQQINRMSTVVSPFTAFLRDVEPLEDSEARRAPGRAAEEIRSASPLAAFEVCETGASPVRLDELIHELRQPLGVIESLTYFIELTTSDEKIAPRLEHIQSMVAKVHHILADASERGIAERPRIRTATEF
jgi:hypothetical protein